MPRGDSSQGAALGQPSKTGWGKAGAPTAAWLLGVAWLIAFTSLPGPAAAAITNLSRAILQDNSYCLGCHAVGSENREALLFDSQLLRDSVHETLTCVDCHRDIDAVPHRLPVAKADCIQCHSQGARLKLIAPSGTSFFGDSRHGTANLEGKANAPTCADCHGDHDTGAITDRGVIAKRCGACHEQQAGQYWESLHGTAFTSGIEDAPVCQNCHPEHPAHGEGRFPQKGVVATCTSCHEDPGLQQRYSIPGNRLASYLGSFHGAASQLGDTRAANCASCHSAHFILPSSDPRASTNHANLTQTCGKCHPGAGQHFAESKIHLQPSFHEDIIVYLARIGYQLFIVGLMSAFVGYILLDVLARVRKRFEPSGRPKRGEWEPQYERLTLHQRLQHWVLISSFITLLVTGLPLSSPGSHLAREVVSFLGGMGTRAAIHRAAAVVLIGLVAYHLFYVLFSRRGYREFKELIPGLQDAWDIIQMLKFYFGFTPIRARFGRYNYIEKFEYLAVGWGSVVMITTGALLWAPHISLLFVPKWVMDVSLIIHSWEAILAFLAIIIWHMYNVHLNPSVFPMSRVWLTGKIGLHEFRENHPLEFERRREKPQAEQEE